MRYKINYNGEIYHPYIGENTPCLVHVRHETVTTTVTVKNSSGAILTNTVIKVNGATFTTSGAGNIVLTGDLGETETFYFFYNNNEYTTKQITFTTNGTVIVQLDPHVISGSTTITAFNNTAASSSTYADAPAWTAPTNVKRIRVTGTVVMSTVFHPSEYDEYGEVANDSWYEYYYGYMKCKNPSKQIIENATVLDKIVSVTPGISYVFQGKGIKNVKLEYSDYMNTLPVNINLT